MARSTRTSLRRRAAGRMAAAGGLLLVPLLGVAIVMLIYFAPSGPEHKSYVETVVESKKKAVAVADVTELAGLYRELEMTAVVNDGRYPPLHELLQTSAIAQKLLRRPGDDTDHPCIYIEGQNENMPASNVLVYDINAAEAHGQGLVLYRNGSIEMLSAEQMEQAVAATRAHIQGR